MRKMYHKYMVKSHKLFIAVVFIFIVLFLSLSLSIDVSIIETFDGTIGDNRVIINRIVDYPIEKVYVYQDRSEKIIPFSVSHIEYVDDIYTVLYVDTDISDKKIEGVIKIDAEKERRSLFSILIGSKKRYVESDLK